MEIKTQRPAIEKLLSASLGGVVRLGEGDLLDERTHVVHFQVLEAPADTPASVIAKGWRSWDETQYDPQSTEPFSPSMRLFNDWAGLQFLSQVMGKACPAPHFIAGDRQSGFFVMEDIGSGQNPADTLLGSDPLLAKAQMLEIATTLGRMHAATIGRQAEFDQLRSGLGPQIPFEAGYIKGLNSRMLASLEHLGIKLQRGTKKDLDQVVRALIDPGPFLAYTHGDPCPDNWRKVGDRMRLFDFEIGSFRHALLDGVYGRIHFPTCWCVNRFPSEIPELMEQVYRAELVKGCPAAADDSLFSSAVSAVCAFWLLETCEGRFSLVNLMEQDFNWGVSTVRQRVLVRSGIFAALTANLGYLQALGETVANLAALLKTRWPQEAEQMPLYPAFA